MKKKEKIRILYNLCESYIELCSEDDMRKVIPEFKYLEDGQVDFFFKTTKHQKEFIEERVFQTLLLIEILKQK